VRFVRQDVREATRESLGTFDVVYLLGLLYHLDAPEVFAVLANVADLCTRLLVVDTLVSLAPATEVVWRGEVYHGARWREHDDADSADVRRGRVLRSIDNAFSFRFARASLLQALHRAGFASVLECHVPCEPGKAADRITLAAIKGTAVGLSTYPWINGLDEQAIAGKLAPDGAALPAADRPGEA